MLLSNSVGAGNLSAIQLKQLIKTWADWPARAHRGRTLPLTGKCPSYLAHSLDVSTGCLLVKTNLYNSYNNAPIVACLHSIRLVRKLQKNVKFDLLLILITESSRKNVKRNLKKILFS